MRSDGLAHEHPSDEAADLARLQLIPTGERDRLFASMFEHAAIGIALVDMDGHPVESNPALHRMLGYTADELGRMVFTDFTHPEDAAADWELFEELCRGERDHYHMTKRYIRKDGELVVGHLTVSLLRDDAGAPEYAIGMVEDVTAREATSEQLRTTETKFRALVEQISAITYTWSWRDDRYFVDYASPQIERILGYTPEEWRADPTGWYDWVHDDDRDAVIAENKRCEKSGEPYSMQYRMIRKDGTVIWVEDSWVVVWNDREEFAFQGVVFDVTARKRAEEKLAESAELLQAIFRSEPECVKLVARDGTLLQMNAAGLEMIEADEPGTVIGECVYPIIADEDREAYRAFNESVFEGGSGRLEFDIVGLKGTRRSMETSSVPLRAPTGEIVASLSVTRDVSERKRAAEELTTTLGDLRRSSEERLRMLGRLVSAQEDERQRIALDIHDDTIQKLTAVGLRLDNLKRAHPALAQDPQCGILTDTVQKAIRRLRTLTFELRPPALDQGSLATALHQLLDLDPEGPAHTIDDRLDTQPSGEAASAAYRIAQEALANIRKHAGATKVDITLASQDGGILVEVRDDGRGMPDAESVSDRPGHVGLVSMRERAELVGGWLKIKSAKDRGTTVSFWLPDADRRRLAAL